MENIRRQDQADANAYFNSFGYKAKKLWEITRETVSMGVSMIPIVGDIKDIQEFLTGYDIIAGRKLSEAEWLITGAAIIIPFVGGKVLSKADEVVDVFSGAAKQVDDVQLYALKAANDGKYPVYVRNMSI